jgi:hypothetical protein
MRFVEGIMRFVRSIGTLLAIGGLFLASVTPTFAENNDRHPGDTRTWQSGEGPQRFTLPDRMSTSNCEVLVVTAAHLSFNGRELAGPNDQVFAVFMGGVSAGSITGVEVQADVPIAGQENVRAQQRLDYARNHASQTGRGLVIVFPT